MRFFHKLIFLKIIVPDRTFPASHHSKRITVVLLGSSQRVGRPGLLHQIHCRSVWLYPGQDGRRRVLSASCSMAVVRCRRCTGGKQNMFHRKRASTLRGTERKQLFACDLIIFTDSQNYGDRSDVNNASG